MTKEDAKLILDALKYSKPHGSPESVERHQKALNAMVTEYERIVRGEKAFDKWEKERSEMRITIELPTLKQGD